MIYAPLNASQVSDLMKSSIEIFHMNILNRQAVHNHALGHILDLEPFNYQDIYVWNYAPYWSFHLFPYYMFTPFTLGLFSPFFSFNETCVSKDSSSPYQEPTI